MEGHNGGKCGCMHHKVGPALITLIGLTFVLGNFNVITGATVGMVWPILLTLFGAGKMFGGMCTCCSKG